MTDRKDWFEGLPISITVAGRDGTIIEMNPKAQETFSKSGGSDLIGKNVFECHPPAARAKLEQLYKDQTPSHYTIRKKGQKKIIHQIPWHINGQFAGYVEISIPIPDELPHFDRDAK
jgi:PAS domain S-box-containing protein